MSSAERTYTVTQLNQAVRNLLEDQWPSIRVSGEISNLARPASGHLYFTVKDAASQVRAAMFRGHNHWLSFAPENGQQVRLRARVSLYPARGDYQLIVEQMELSGEGALQAAFDALKTKLSAEGLFNPDHKQPIPDHPARIGVITSPTGAALRDILTVLRRRFPLIPVTLYPSAVQGSTAPEQIIRALQQAGRRADCDVLIISRGGGSLEDLQAFNQEGVARAVYACPIPTISGVGHEVDFSITDFVADFRAPTPSAAAEAASPDQAEWYRYLLGLRQRLLDNLERRIHHDHQRLQWLQSRLRHPRQRLQDASQRLDNLNLRLTARTRGLLSKANAQLQGLAARLAVHQPASRLARNRDQLLALQHRLLRALPQITQAKHNRLQMAVRGLQLVSPLATLDRGYAIITRADDGRLVTQGSQVQAGEQVDARLSAGQLRCTVLDIVTDEG